MSMRHAKIAEFRRENAGRKGAMKVCFYETQLNVNIRIILRFTY